MEIKSTLSLSTIVTVAVYASHFTSLTVRADCRTDSVLRIQRHGIRGD